MWKSAGTILLGLVTFEDALFGSGRMLQIGPLTVRMILYSLALIYIAFSLLTFRRITRTTLLLTSSFAALLCIAWVNGIVHSANTKYIGEDISPLLALFMLPFFELTIRSERQITLAIRIIKAAAIIMLMGYAALAVALLTRIVTFPSLYAWMNSWGGEDFVFEGVKGLVFYKGSLFMGVALIFFAFERRRWSRVTSFLLLLGLFMTGLRGFFVALAFTAILYVLIGPMRPTKKLAFACAAFILAATALPLLFTVYAKKTRSNNVRITTIQQVADRVNIVSLVVGHGFGMGVPERRVHMEITYLEIFQKQGCLGLLWWSAFIVLLAVRFTKAVEVSDRNLAYPLMLSAAFIFFESGTNPFLNNPIGMYPFMMSFVGLRVLAQPNPSLPGASRGQ